MLFAQRIKLSLCFISLALHVGHSRYIEDDDEGLLSLNLDQEKEDFIFRRPLKCLDMLAMEGQFTFVASQPQLACATFFMAEPSELLSLELSDVNIDCTAGDFIKMFDGWVLKGERFPSSQDHPLPLHQRYTDYCTSRVPGGTTRSSQNVAMVFFRIHSPESGFTLTVRKLHNPFPCNIMSQSPEGSFSMVLPHQHRNCSFSVIYPVEIQLTELSLAQAKSNDLRPQKQLWSGCAGAGDHVELLGGNGVDTSKMYPVADLCFSLSALSHMKIGCDNSVVRLVSSGNYINRVSFQYRLLDRHELPKPRENSLDDYCSVE